MNHEGSIEELKTIIEGSGHNISTVEENEHSYQIRTEEGAICNWYHGTGTVQFQGKKDRRDELKEDVIQYIGEG